MRYALGVDLGTTYSAAAVGRDDQVAVESLGTVSSAIPSVVVLRADGEVLTGEAAERRAISEPTRTAREFKRRLGDPAPLILGGTPYGAEALQARLLRAIVDAVAEREGTRPDVIVLTHPANYGAYKRSLLDEVVKLADVGEVVLISEPEAAAVDYASRDRLDPGQVVAVYDFGGGTFDAAVLRKTDDGFVLLGTPEGMEHLGGIDFDQAILAHVEASLGGRLAALDAREPGIRAALGRLRDDCRTAKESLSADTDAVVPVVLPGINEQVRITRTEFEAMIRPRIGETVAALERAVRSAGLAMSDVSRVLLVGGSSRIPLVAELVGSATGRPVAVDSHPKLVVALGAARFGLGRLAAIESVEPGRSDVPAELRAPAEAVVPAAPVVPGPREQPSRLGHVRLPALVAALLVVTAVTAYALVGGGGAGGHQATATPAATAITPTAVAATMAASSVAAGASSGAPSPAPSVPAPTLVRISVPDPCSSASSWNALVIVDYHGATYDGATLRLAQFPPMDPTSTSGSTQAFQVDWQVAVAKLSDYQSGFFVPSDAPTSWSISVSGRSPSSNSVFGRQQTVVATGQIQRVPSGSRCP